MLAEMHCDPTSVSPPEDEENVRPYKGMLVLARQMVSHMEIIKMGTHLSDLSFTAIIYHCYLFSSSLSFNLPRFCFCFCLSYSMFVHRWNDQLSTVFTVFSILISITMQTTIQCPF
jgi:hypothetical protein